MQCLLVGATMSLHAAHALEEAPKAGHSLTALRSVRHHDTSKASHVVPVVSTAFVLSATVLYHHFVKPPLHCLDHLSIGAGRSGGLLGRKHRLTLAVSQPHRRSPVLVCDEDCSVHHVPDAGYVFAVASVDLERLPALDGKMFTATSAGRTGAEATMARPSLSLSDVGIVQSASCAQIHHLIDDAVEFRS